MSSTEKNPYQFQNLIPKPNSRALLVGKTGCGKTTLAKHLINHSGIPDKVIIDPKGMFDYPGELVYSPEELSKVKGRSIIYRPELDFLGVEEYDRVLRWVYNRKNTLLYIDEIYGLSANGYTYPSSLQGVYTRGRERGITIIACTQRPTSLPQYCITESEYFYCFELKKEEDRKRMSGMMGEEVKARAFNPAINGSDPHDFWFYHDKMREDAVLLNVKPGK